MSAVFAKLKELGVYDEATIIVHGDHGSRIGEMPYIVDSPDVYSDQDLLDNFATLLAIKAPGVAPGVRDEPVPLQQIFAQRFLGRGIEAESNDLLVHTGDDDRFGPRPFVWNGAVAQAPAEQAVAIEGMDTELRR